LLKIRNLLAIVLDLNPSFLKHKKKNPTQPNNKKAFCDQRRGEEEGEEERLVVEVMGVGRHVS
jgi:hypothetical protein